MATLRPLTPAPGGGAVDARLATLMPLTTPAPGGDAVDDRLATLRQLTPAPGGGAEESQKHLLRGQLGELGCQKYLLGEQLERYRRDVGESVHRSEVYGRQLYLVIRTCDQILLNKYCAFSYNKL